MLLKLLAREAARLAGNVRSGNPLDLPLVPRQTGTWNHADLEWMASKAAQVPGDFAEIGVFRGAAFRKVAALAGRHGKRAHAFDSFTGMNDPSPGDDGSYPKGMFDIGGPEVFVQGMTASGIDRTRYDVWPGYVPECFTQIPDDVRFSWAIVDLDNYQPTADALRWVPGRINPSGILALDDYVPDKNRGKLATRAIDEFLATEHGFEKIALFNQHMILRRNSRA
jgi:O-methyltransferase